MKPDSYAARLRELAEAHRRREALVGPLLSPCVTLSADEAEEIAAALEEAAGLAQDVNDGHGHYRTTGYYRLVDALAALDRRAGREAPRG